MKLPQILLRPTSLATVAAGGLLGVVFWLGRIWLTLPWLFVIMLVILFGYGLIMIVLRLRASRASSKLEDSLQEDGDVPPGREREREELKIRFKEAIQALKQSQIGRGREGALYVLPWYVIIGPPAAGKTTLLERSGLSFPYLDPIRERSAVPGVGGTRNCDWWFADEAVIVDTGGRYVRAVEADDKDEWLGFLDLLRKHRGRKPINGLVVVVSIQDLVGGSAESLEEHARHIRARIDQLIQRLRLTFPVYVTIAKCDLIPGFVEFFDALSPAERMQVVGCTLAQDRASRESGEEIIEDEIRRLSKALHHMGIGRVAAAERQDARPDMGLFPFQLAALKKPLSRFVTILFKPNPYQESPIFRGFYFTSGTQEGQAIDQIINPALSDFGGGGLVPDGHALSEGTRGFFIHDLFTKIMFRDRNMAGPSAAGEKRRRKTRVWTMAGAAGLLAIFAVYLSLTANMNHDSLAGVKDLCYEVKQNAEFRGGGRLRMDHLAELDSLREELLDLEAKGSLGSQIRNLWTSQGSEVLDAARHLQFAVLRETAINPAIDGLLRKLRRDAGVAGEFFPTYERYQTLLLLQRAADLLNGPQAALHVAGVLADHWHERSSGEDRQDYERLIRRQLDHVTRYADTRIDAFPPAPFRDTVLEADVRLRLQMGWSVEGLGPALVAAAGELAHLNADSLIGEEHWLRCPIDIQPAYTRAGWEGPVRQFLARVEAVRGERILKDIYRPESPTDLRAGLIERYAEEYIAQWLGVMAAVVTDIESETKPTKTFLEAAAEESSPIVQLLRDVSEQTEYKRDDDPGMIRVDDAFRPIRAFLLGSSSAIGGVVVGGQEAEERPPLHKYLTLVAALSEAYLANAGNPRETDFKESFELDTWIDEAVENQGGSVAEELARLLRIPIRVVHRTNVDVRMSRIEDNWKPVARQFKEELEGRYPLKRTEDRHIAASSDFDKFFGPQGIFWEFYRDNLAGIVSEDGGRILDGSVSISQRFRTALAKAKKIRDTLYGDGSSAGFTLSLRPRVPQRDRNTGISARSTHLAVGGDELVWAGGAPRVGQMTWPGEDRDLGAKLDFEAANAKATPKSYAGVWGFFELLDEATIEIEDATGTIGWTIATNAGVVRIYYDVINLPRTHPLDKELLTWRSPTRVCRGR